jgi:hypothetical protein
MIWGIAHSPSAEFQRFAMKFSIRWFLVFTAWAALLMFSIVQAMKPRPPSIQGPPSSVLRAVQQEVPGMIVETIGPEIFNDKPAWVVTGTDPRGERWMLDVRPNGEMLMAEKNP